MSNGKGGALWLGIGVFLILCNVVAIFGIDTRPNVWLFYLDIRNWPTHVSIILWVTAIWIALESADIAENYRLFIRVPAAICILLVIIFALWTSMSFTSSVLWFSTVVIAFCCMIRSLFLFRHYRHEGEEAIDLEEAKWFWGLSGFLCIGLVLLGFMHIIPVKMQIHVGADDFVSLSLLRVCYDGLQDLIRHGRGSLAILAFGAFLFTVVITFVYVAGKWMLIFLSRIMRGE